MLLNFFLENIIKEQIIKIYNFSYDKSYKLYNFFWVSNARNNANMFIAIKGNNTNGNFFIENAIHNGYTSIMSDDIIIIKTYIKKYPNIIFIVVKNIHDTLNMMAKWGASNFSGKKFAITGSSGKTTTTYILTNILKNFGTVVSTDKYNSQYYLKRLCFFLYKSKEDFFVAELSSDRLGSIDLYGEIIKPHYSIITSIGSAHLQHFKTEENILLEKTSLFKHTLQAGFIPYVYKDLMLKNNILFSNSKITIYYVENNFTIYNNENVNFIDGIILHNSNLKGVHNFSNMNLVLHLIKYLGFTLNENIGKTLSNLNCFPGRGNLITIDTPNNFNKKLVLTCDHHNSNYESFLNAIENIKNNSLLIMGFIYEIGETTNEKIIKILQFIEKNSNIKYIFLGDQELLKVPNILNFSKVLPIDIDLINFIKDNHNIENIFLKGSRGSKLEKYIEKILNFIN